MSANRQRFFVDVKNGLQWESENIIFSSVENALHFANTNFPQNKWRIVDNLENVCASSSGLANLESDANEQLNRFQYVERARSYYENLRRTRNSPRNDRIAQPQQDQIWIAPAAIHRNQTSPHFPLDFFNNDFLKPKKQKLEYEEVDWMKEGF